MHQLIIKNGTLITPNGRKQADIAVENGKIIAIGDFQNAKAENIIDAKGQFVLPGLVDTQTHMREPGLTHKEDLESGTRGAVLGGLTGVFEMPNTNPATTSKEALAHKVSLMKDRAWCDFAFYVGGTPDNTIDWSQLETLPGCCGIKIFMGSSTGNLLVSQDEAVRYILQNCKGNVAVHSEDENILKERKKIAEEGADPKFHPVWRNEQSALNCTMRLLKIAREVGHRVHVLHISSAEEMALLALNKDICTVEVLANHLTFDASQYEEFGTLLQMNPPIRDIQHQKRIWEALADGTVDIIGSDHAPHTLEEKSKPYPQSPSGITGVQTIVPMMLAHVNNGRLTLEKLVDLMAHNLEPVFGTINKGRIVKGYDADFTIVDMEKEHTFSNSEIASKAGWTLLDGKTTKGMPTHTVIRGNIVMQNGQLVSRHIGKPIEFTHASRMV